MRTGRCWARSTTGSSARARTRSSTIGWARIRSSTRAPPACTSRCGRRTRGASPSSAISTAGTAAATRCASASDTGVWEIFVPALREGDDLQVRDHRRRRHAAAAQGGSGRLPRRAAAVDRVDRLRHGRLRVVRRRVDGGPRARSEPRRAPMCDLRGAPGIVAARRGQSLAHLRRARRHAGALRRRHGLHAPRADAGQRASAGRVLGLPADRTLRADEPLRRARRVRALRRSLPSRRAGRDPRLGARALSRSTRTASRSSTARPSTSTPTRAWASIRTGTPRSSTSGGRRSSTTSSPTRCSGSTATTSTACASTPSPRCSTSTTRARPASGCRTATAATRTSRPSRSCAG